MHAIWCVLSPWQPIQIVAPPRSTRRNTAQAIHSAAGAVCGRLLQTDPFKIFKTSPVALSMAAAQPARSAFLHTAR